MHAASVHPEPGSNSRKICINTIHRIVPIFFPSLFCSYLLVRVSSSKEFRDSYFRTYIALYLSLLFNFQGSMPSHFSVPPSLPAHRSVSVRPLYITTSASVCQALFKSFFNFFRALQTRFHGSLPRFSGQLY